MSVSTKIDATLLHICFLNRHFSANFDRIIPIPYQADPASVSDLCQACLYTDWTATTSRSGCWESHTKNCKRSAIWRTIITRLATANGSRVIILVAVEFFFTMASGTVDPVKIFPPCSLIIIIQLLCLIPYWYS